MKRLKKAYLVFRELEMFITYYIQNLLDTIPLKVYHYKKTDLYNSIKEKNSYKNKWLTDGF